MRRCRWGSQSSPASCVSLGVLVLCCCRASHRAPQTIVAGKAADALPGTNLICCYPACLPACLQTLAAARPGSRGGRARSQTRWQRKTARLAREAGLEEEAGTEAAALAAGENDGSAGQLEGRVDLPRLYEHFIFAMAHKGQYAGTPGRQVVQPPAAPAAAS